MKIIDMNRKRVKITSYEQLTKVYGVETNAIAETLSFALGRHLLMRELLDKKDSYGYDMATNLLARAIQTFPDTAIKTNQCGWATQIDVARDDVVYYIPLSKRTWSFCAQSLLDRNDAGKDDVIVQDVQAEKEEPIEPVIDPDNEDYDDGEVVLDESNIDSERFLGTCLTVAALRDSLFGAPSDCPLYALNNGEAVLVSLATGAGWESNDVCYLNDGSIGEEKTNINNVGELLHALERFSDAANVYYYTQNHSFLRVSTPWRGRDALGGLDDDGTMRVWFELVDEE